MVFVAEEKDDKYDEQWQAEYKNDGCYGDYGFGGLVAKVEITPVGGLSMLPRLFVMSGGFRAILISHDAERVCKGFAIDNRIPKFDYPLLVSGFVVFCNGSVHSMCQCAIHHGNH